MEQQTGYLLEHDGLITIANGKKKDSKTYTMEQLKISEFAKRLREFKVGRETFAEYQAMDKESRGVCKDKSGGYVGASVKNKSRAKENIQCRQLITLDLDHLKESDDFSMLLQDKLDNVCYTAHSTHSHSIKEPRIRLIIYPNRPISRDEYQAVARGLAGLVGIDLFDDTTYDINRMMFYPSRCADGAWYWHHNDAPLLDVDKFLKQTYGVGHAWRDVNKWPVSSRQVTRLRSGFEKAADPASKKNIVGAFCRAYDIHQAIDKFLSDKYEQSRGPGAKADRYTYLGGSSVNGAVVYDSNFMYSNHESDPASQQLCNSFDLVRVHLFGEQDTNSRASDPRKLPSFRSMCEFIESDERVVAQMITTRDVDMSAMGFDAIEDEQEPVKVDAETSWQSRLQRAEEGGVRSTQFNANMIVSNDSGLRKRARYNEFTDQIVKHDGDDWTDYDTTLYLHYIGEKYNVDYGVDKMDRAVEFSAMQHKFHPVRDMMEAIEWDGVARLDTLFIDYWKTEDNAYYREIAKNTLIAACRRNLRKGYKFDYAPVIEGPQGIGKTTFIMALGFEKFYSTLDSMEPSRAIECLQGALIAEISELTAMNASDLQAQKKFMSDTSTRVRLAYMRHAKNYFRKCVFLGTTNQHEYLKDPTGNRRWWPVVPGLKKGEFWDYEKFVAEREQIWAEAWARAKGDESTELSKSAVVIARRLQNDARQADDWEGIIESWLAQEASVNRYERCGDGSITQQRSPYSATEPRTKVCNPEIMLDCLRIENPTPAQTKRLERTMEVLHARHAHWVVVKRKRFGKYGRQKGWESPDGPMVVEYEF